MMAVDGDLGVGGDAADFLLHLVNGGLELAGTGADAAGAPIHATEFVEDGPTDAHRGVAGKGGALFGVKLADGRDEAGDADAVKIVGIDVRGHVEFDAVDDIADEGEIPFDQILFIDGARRNSLIRAPGGGGRSIHARERSSGGIHGGWTNGYLLLAVAVAAA